MTQHPIHQYKTKTKALRGKPLRTYPQPQVAYVPHFLRPVEVARILQNMPLDFQRTKVAEGSVSEVPLDVGDDAWDWLYDRLWDGFTSYATALGLGVTGMYEEPVVLKYGIKDQNGWHSDYDVSDRSKVSVSVVLNDHSEYEGGDLEVLRTDVPRLEKPGEALFFSGYLAHRVTPVISGERTVLVAWAGGPALW